MNKEEKAEDQKMEELFEKFKSVELTPLPYFTHELLSLPDAELFRPQGSI